MRLKQKVEYIASKLEELYPNPEIPLDHENNFTFLIAVMLSAQSTDKKVNEITPKLFSKANTPEKMDKLEINEIRDSLTYIESQLQDFKENNNITKVDKDSDRFYQNINTLQAEKSNVIIEQKYLEYLKSY